MPPPAHGGLGSGLARWAIVAALLGLLNVAVWFRSAPSGAARPSGPPGSAARHAPEDGSAAQDPLPQQRFAAISVHEHAQSEADIERLLRAMDGLGIERACILAAALVTFDHRHQGGFEGFEDNNEVLLRAKARHPSRICAFVTLHPPAEGNLERLERYVARGADGLKLYLGHPGHTATEPFHMMPIDDPRLYPVFAYAERTQLPITMHVDLGQYGAELVRLMDRFPSLRVNLPHFGVHKNSAERLDRLGRLLDAYPNLYVDTSFGHRDIQLADFETIAANRERFAAFITRYADRVMFASDLVVTAQTSDAVLRATLSSYMQILETDRFRFFLRPERAMHGLALPDDVLQAVYRDTPAAFLKLSVPAGTAPRSTDREAAGTRGS